MKWQSQDLNLCQGFPGGTRFADSLGGPAGRGVALLALITTVKGYEKGKGRMGQRPEQPDAGFQEPSPRGVRAGVLRSSSNKM